MHAGKKPRVLVVDDEQVIADTLAKILDLNGYDASAVYTGTAAVESARALQPDLVISDVIMPDMNGIEAAISIRGFLAQLQDPALLRTGRDRRSAGERTGPGPRIRDPGKAGSSIRLAGKVKELVED